MKTFAELIEYFAANPDGFLSVQTIITSPPDRFGENEWKTVGGGPITLFQIGRVPGKHEDYVNVIGLDGHTFLESVYPFKDGSVLGDDYRRFDKQTSRLAYRHTFDMETVRVETLLDSEKIKVYRWKNEVLKKAGLLPVNTAEVFQSAKNAASSEFFASLFSGSAVPSKDNLWEGVRILNEQIQAQGSGDESLKLNDPVIFTHEGVTRDAKVVELFPADDKVAVLTNKGQTAVISYADVTRIK